MVEFESHSHSIALLALFMSMQSHTSSFLFSDTTNADNHVVVFSIFPEFLVAPGI